MGFFRRLANVVRTRRLSEDFEEELEFHREMRRRNARAQGLSEPEAEQTVKRRMGNLSLAKEQMRDARVIPWLASTAQDLHHGVVLLRRDAAISMLIVSILALGISGNSAIFTLLKSAFLDPLPYRDAGRLVTVLEVTGGIPNTAEFLEIRARSQALEQIAFAEYRDMQLSEMGEPARIYTAGVTASFFRVLGVDASLGRTFLPEENQLNRTPSVVLTNAFWRSKLGADPRAVGRTLRLDGKPALVVGVLPSNFQFDYPTLQIPEPLDLYVSYPLETNLTLGASLNGHGVPVRVIARLRNGVTLAQAQADARRIASVLTHEHPEAFPNPQHNPNLFTFLVIPLREAIVGKQRSQLWLLLSAVGILLLIACANVAQLLLARSLRRRREIAIRSALGASRLRLIRQFLLEGLVLALGGGAIGLLLTGWIVRILTSLLPVRNPLFASAHIDLWVASFTAAISFFSAVLFATIPAIKGSSGTQGPSLNLRVAIGEGNRWRNAMLALEVALSVFLLCGVGLMAQNLRALIFSPMGFDPDHVVVMKVKLPGQPQQHMDHNAGRIFQEYVDKISNIPGVDSAASVTGPPLRWERGGNAELVGVTDASGALKSITAVNHLVSRDYFRAFRIPLLAGRGFTKDDAGPHVTVAIVNQEFARRFGLGANVVGKQLSEPRAPITIVGMVGNVRTRGLEVAAYPEVYLSSLQLSWANTYIVVRSAIPTTQLMQQVKIAIRSTNSEQPIFGVMTMDELITSSVAEPRFDIIVIGAFALLAVVMAGAGMYSVVSCLVSQRTSEIAIRMALGATRRTIIRNILASTSLWTIAGLFGGLGLGLATSNTLRLLADIEAHDSPWIYVSVALFFAFLMLAAVYRPAQRASRLDPAVALRSE